MGLTFSCILVAIVWNSVRRPIVQLSRNLKHLAEENGEKRIEAIHIAEFDAYMDDFSRLRRDIIELIEAVQRKEEEKARLEVKQVLSKINPHFLYNTLHSLRVMMRDRGDYQAEEFIAMLTRLLIYNMEKNKVTTLANELQAVDDYIGLQSSKYELEYQKHIDLPPVLLRTEMPRFILQPSVENAILHGLEGHGRISVKAGLSEDGKIVIRIVNNGYPIDAERVREILSSVRDLSTSGIGIQYVFRMLELKFGDEARFALYTDEAGENVAEIQMPYNIGDYYVQSVDR